MSSLPLPRGEPTFLAKLALLLAPLLALLLVGEAEVLPAPAAATRARRPAAEGAASASASPAPVGPPAPAAAGAPRACVTLADRGGADLLYHWFVLNVGALWAHYEPGATVDVYAPFLSGGGARYHGESQALFWPDFYFPPGADSAAGDCAPEFGTALWADDRPDPQAHFFLRGLFARALARAPGGAPAFNASELVYVTRAGRPQRAVLNEEAFLPALAALGVRRVQLEDLSFAEKLRLFASARLVVSPQSAGLTFLAAADRRALVVEIFQEVDAMNHYRYMADDLAVPFRRFSALEVVGPTVPIFNAHFNFVVDAPALVAFVTRALAETAPRAAGPPVVSNVTEAIDKKAGF